MDMLSTVSNGLILMATLTRLAAFVRLRWKSGNVAPYRREGKVVYVDFPSGAAFPRWMARRGQKNRGVLIQLMPVKTDTGLSAA